MTVAITVTSISSPTAAVKELAAEGSRNGWQLIVAGDLKSPERYDLANCRYLSIHTQRKSGFALALAAPTGHYCRKNIAYLTAIEEGAPVIVETDDDNFPKPEFFAPRTREVECPVISNNGWVNVYRYFSDHTIWPRGFPLDKIHVEPPHRESLPFQRVDCPIQQGLVDGNPDVDAVYRLTCTLPLDFRKAGPVSLTRDSWCPFNSQNTTWWADAYPLLYLPAHCSFRLTDIWRGMVAMRVAWTNQWGLLYHESTAYQIRNAHDLMRDFSDEIPGYLANAAVGQVLSELNLDSGISHIPENMQRCYKALIDMGLVGEAELSLLDLWFSDLERLGHL